MNEICKIFAAETDENVIRDFFAALLTPAELSDVEKRWAIIRAMEQGVSQRKIAEELKISLCKITRGSSELKKRDSAFKKMLAVLAAAEKTPASDSEKMGREKMDREKNGVTRME
ncbi:MAG: hypothetical protein Ta2A_21760 [Treponemataceae bacterium]|nr:MAG: hypothetical protein Ta2A_21760 [Treponemataceae bacterium]